MIHEFRNPMPVETPLGYGMLVYVRDGGAFANDVFAVVLDRDGVIRHMTTDQFKLLRNDTYGIRTEDNPRKNAEIKAGQSPQG